MARYRKIDVRMYGDEKYCALSRAQPNGQTLWQFLLSGPHTSSIPGLSVAGEAGMAEALQWPLEGFREAFAEVLAKGMAKADWRARVVWLPNAVKYNPPESPNVITGWRKAWDEVPECALKSEALLRLKSSIAGMSAKFLQAFQKAFPEAFAEGLPKGFGDPFPNQEQEQEQEQEIKLPPEASAEPAVRASPAVAAAPPGASGGNRGNPGASTARGEPPVLVFDCVGGRSNKSPTWSLTEAYVVELAEQFPGVDVRAECRKALGWTRAKPANRKTADGMASFLWKWMQRAQNDGRSHRTQNGAINGHRKPRPMHDPDLPSGVTRHE